MIEYEVLHRRIDALEKRVVQLLDRTENLAWRDAYGVLSDDKPSAVRDAVLDGLIAEAGESRVIYYEFNLRPGHEREQRLADWLRSMKGTP